MPLGGLGPGQEHQWSAVQASRGSLLGQNGGKSAKHGLSRRHEAWRKEIQVRYARLLDAAGYHIKIPLVAKFSLCSTFLVLFELCSDILIKSVLRPYLTPDL